MKTVVIVSGGMDSTVLLHIQVRKWGAGNVKALSFDYGQRHKVELDCAEYQCEKLGVAWEVVDLSGITKLLAPSGSALVDHDVDVPTGHYESANMKATVVPNRNMIMLSVAAGHAMALGAEGVAYGAHPGDHAIYPDCRSEFAEAMAGAIALADWSEVKLERPFVETNTDKAGIAKIGSDIGVDFSKTWSCYKGGELHCGNCGTCVERREAFLLASVVDVTEYACTALELDSLLAQKEDAIPCRTELEER
jgi:7-cyano-7-deazaguanine synthase